MAITQEELAQGFETIYDDFSGDPNIDPAEARKLIAQRQAELIAQFVIGRKTTVTGTTSDAKAVNGTGTIQE